MPQWLGWMDWVQWIYLHAHRIGKGMEGNGSLLLFGQNALRLQEVNPGTHIHIKKDNCAQIEFGTVAEMLVRRSVRVHGSACT
eukprot:1159945-Pelagomonas_calceolata.AAC.1